MKHWIGRWLIGVSVLHSLFAVSVFHTAYSALIARGFVNAIGNDARAGAAVWFFLFGVALFLCGIAVSALERSSLPVPRTLGWGLLVLGFLGIALMPASGFWLVLPPALAILFRRQPVQAHP
jgi:hypothetical protein